MLVGIGLSALLMLAVNLLAWKWKKLACALAWSATVVAAGLVVYLDAARILILFPVLLALLTTAGLSAVLKPQLFAGASLLLAVIAAVAVALSPAPRRPDTTHTDEFAYPELPTIPRRPFYPDDRLFVCRYGTGLDPTLEVEHLPRHVQSLPEIHERYVDQFIRRQGFGQGRYSWSPSQWVELVSEDAPAAASVLQKDYPQRDSFPGQEATSRPKYDDDAIVLSLPGDRRQVREHVWSLRGMQLVGLVKHKSPTVYVRDDVAGHPGKDEKPVPAQTRAPDAFESAALAKLRQGTEVVADTTASQMRLLGAIRARQECLSCHEVEVGRLLGAFSYTLAVRSEETPAAERLADLVGLSADEVEAVREIEQIGGTVRRASNGGPVTEVKLNVVRSSTDRGRKNVKDHHAAVKALSAFKGLTTLDLSYLKITDESLQNVEQLPDLVSLDVSGNKITDAGLKRIGKLKTLRVLKLWTTEVTDDGLKHLRGLDRLEELHLAQTSVTDKGVAQLAGIGRLRKIELLNMLAPITDESLPHLAKIDSLEEIGLGRTKITGAGLSEFRQLPNLRVLDLSHNPLSDEGLKQLGELTQLRVLHLNCVEMKGPWLKRLASLTNLHTLALGVCHVNDEGLAALAPLKQLHSLDLSNSDVTDAGLASLRAFPVLESLDFGQGSKITDDGLKEIARLKRLRQINLGGTKVSDAGVASLLRALPQCQIDRK
jgi:Leucine-rich repeat (LRR) protein